MKALALTARRRLELVEIAPPALRLETDVLLQVEQVGICGSDLHYFVEGGIGSQVVQYPFVIGHECSGTVSTTGPSVTRVRPGDLVAVDPAMSCHQCDQCRSGREHTCRRLRFLGCPGESPGCLSEFIVMPEASLYPVTGRLTAIQAALCEPLSIGIYAVRLAQLPPQSAVAILGAGPIGLCVLLAARDAGAGSISMTDRIPERVHSAVRMGADWAGNPDLEDVVAAMLEHHPQGFDVVFECAGQPETLDQALALLRPGGRLVVVGIPRTPRVSFSIDLLRRKEITITNVRRQNRCVAPAIESVASGRANVESLVTHRFPPEQAQAAFEMVEAYRDGVLKATIGFA